MSQLTYEDLNEIQKIGASMLVEWASSAKRTPFILSGYAGTGKTSMLLVALAMAGYSLDKVLFMAPTGKAASVMRSKGMNSQTIHSAIYNVRQDAYGNTSFEIVDREDLDYYEVFVVDEAGMTSREIRDDLSSFAKPIIFVGDNAQLGPVVLEGQSSDNIMDHPSIVLDQIMRTALDNPIIIAATLARQGKHVPIGQKGKGFLKAPNRRLRDTELLCRADVVLCGFNKTRHALNDRIREHKGFSGDIPEIGEKVICIKNNRNYCIFNGMTGVVEDIRYKDGALLMDFKPDGQEDVITEIPVSEQCFTDDSADKRGKDIAYFQFGYALSVHKSQGSEWPKVVIVEERMPRSLLRDHHRWIYTAITRASKAAVLISRGET